MSTLTITSAPLLYWVTIVSLIAVAVFTASTINRAICRRYASTVATTDRNFSLGKRK